MIRVKLLEQMEKAGVRSQDDLATKAHLSKTTVTNIRRRHTFRHDTLNTLCNVLNCTPADLLEYEPDEAESAGL